jgi:spore coat protein U-like protein
MIRRGILAMVLLVPMPAAAQTTSLVCSLGASGVDFGVFSGPQLTSVGTLTIRCTGGGNINNATLTLSTGNSGTYAARQMRNGSTSLSYNLYTDATFTQIWGDGTGGSVPVTRTGGPQVLLVPVYGKLPAQPEPPSGAYSDTIVARLDCPGNSCNTVTTAFNVVTNTVADCRISATNLFFGDYTQAQLDGQSQILLTCTTGALWNIGLNDGIFPGATVTTRRMEGRGNSSLMYSLFRDAARTLNWGNTVGTDTVSGTGTGSLQTVPVYGRIPASQPAAPGGYFDTIIATITF